MRRPIVLGHFMRPDRDRLKKPRLVPLTFLLPSLPILSFIRAPRGNAFSLILPSHSLSLSHVVRRLLFHIIRDGGMLLPSILPPPLSLAPSHSLDPSYFIFFPGRRDDSVPSVSLSDSITPRELSACVMPVAVGAARGVRLRRAANSNPRPLFSS